ncbi:methyltransferase, FkbM family [alpha proteobacterium HIMB114]|nr:methyltransferase, FkbM family [alpha proteobacterium HIMB114]
MISSYFETQHQKKLNNYLKTLNISFLIDVGSYKGNFMKNFNQENLEHIYLFEPNFEKYKTLRSKFKSFNIYNTALSDKKSVEDFVICSKEDTTSTLENALNKNSFLYYVKTKILKKDYIKKIKVEVNKLDNIFNEDIYPNSFLKIDTEGSDLQVLKGGENFLKKVNYVLIEVKKFNLYNNCKKEDILKFLIKKNFKMIKVFSSFPYLYQDILFERS